MDLDISKEIQRITEQIIEKYKPDRIILFGSAARGELEPDSDADFPWTFSSTVQKNLNNHSKWEILF